MKRSSTMLCKRIMIGLALATFLWNVASAADWPSWRGPAQTGVSCETGLPASADRILWRAPYGARSTAAIHDGRVFVINLAGEGVMEQERVMALNLADGKPVWEHRFNVFHTDIPNSRVGWANVTVDPETGNVYAHGVQGMFFCFDRDGEILWSRSLTEQFGRISGYGGRIHTPVVDEDRVIISFLNSSFGDQAKGGHRYLAMDKRTGETLWWAEPGGTPTDTTYAVPVVAVIDGQRLLIAGNADGAIYAMKARTGEKVWGFRFCKSGINPSVVADGHRVYASHGEENYDTTTLGRVVCIDGRGAGDITESNEIWRHDGIEAGYASPLVHDKRLYVMNNFGVLYCLDSENGGKIWEHTVGRVGKGSPVWADGRLYVTAVNGAFTILEDMGTEARVLDSMNFESPNDVAIELFGSPAIADGKVVFFTTAEAICIGGTGGGVSRDADPPLPAESSAVASAKPAHLQVRPAEVLIKPGDSVSFRAVAFDNNGRELTPVSTQWSCDPSGGSIDGEGRYQSPAAGGGIAVVVAKLGELSASGRVRFVPELPIAEDFESYGDGKLPPWWIGVTKAKHAVETIDGSKALKKLADERGPMFNRSTVFITPPLAPGYTIEADVKGAKDGRRRGDVGLINNRYRLEMFGRAKRMRIVSWVPGPRFEARLDNFTWDADRWYRVKFHVDVKDGKALVRAKVWPRGESEPNKWLLEGVDPQPNLEGAAGLYAYSAAPLYYDNIRIYREEKQP